MRKFSILIEVNDNRIELKTAGEIASVFEVIGILELEQFRLLAITAQTQAKKEVSSDNVGH